MDQLEIDARRGEQAEQLLAHPLIVEARERLEAEIFRQFKESHLRDKEGREYLRLMQHVATLFFGYLESAVSDGKVAKLEIKQKGIGAMMRRVI